MEGVTHLPAAGCGHGLHEVRAEVCVIHQDLEHRAHVEVTAVNGDPGPPCLWTQGRLQGVDHGQLGRRKGG